MNKYNVIGLMSGTSLDGLDIAHCRFTYENENWIYEILNAATLEYTDKWIVSLRDIENASARDIMALDHAYGKLLGESTYNFIVENQLKPDFIASHGHTIFHQPAQHISHQLGHGAYIAAHAKTPVISDFRTLDIALGGQGAPLVPIGDALLFSDYDFCLNLGGIANVSYKAGDKRLAFDTCGCNILLNNLANQLGKNYDENGALARSGKLVSELFDELNEPSFFLVNPPKSLGKEWLLENSLATLARSAASVPDKLHTACHHIAYQISKALPQLHQQQHRVLITGGGAFNSYLIELIEQYLGGKYTVEVPAPEVVSYKEALIFAFLGVLRWRQEPNCLSSVTGASHDNIGGSVFLC